MPSIETDDGGGRGMVARMYEWMDGWMDGRVRAWLWIDKMEMSVLVLGVYAEVGADLAMGQKNKELITDGDESEEGKSRLGEEWTEKSDTSENAARRRSSSVIMNNDDVVNSCCVK